MTNNDTRADAPNPLTDAEVVARLMAIRDLSLAGWHDKLTELNFKGISALQDSFSKAVSELVRLGGAEPGSTGAITLNGIDLSKFVFGPRDDDAREDA